MKKYLKSKYKFPIFFIGVMLIVLSGFLNKFYIINLLQTELAVAIGFVILFLSIAL